MANALNEHRLSEREHLLAALETEGYLNDPRLEEAMLGMPRHQFLPSDLADQAYEDKPLPVGFGQTVSAPHMVAMMTTALQLEPGQHVLEIGTGVGYHAAVAKGMVGPTGRVTSIEYLPELAELARMNFKAAGIDVNVIHGDGYNGAPEHSPFDAIYVTCAIPQIPLTLVDQLKDGGHFAAPIGQTRCQLLAGRRIGDEMELDDLGPCLFVNSQGRLGESDGSWDWDEDDTDPGDDDGGGILTPPA